MDEIFSPIFIIIQCLRNLKLEHFRGKLKYSKKKKIEKVNLFLFSAKWNVPSSVKIEIK